jgi:hypothetical protein
MTIPGYDAWRLQGPHDDACPDCGGDGVCDCPACEGDTCPICEGDTCPICEGTGTVECETCHGDEPDGDYEYERRRDAAMEDRE